MALLSLPHVDDVTEVFTLLSDIYDTLHMCVFSAGAPHIVSFILVSDLVTLLPEFGLNLSSAPATVCCLFIYLFLVCDWWNEQRSSWYFSLDLAPGDLV